MEWYETPSPAPAATAPEKAPPVYRGPDRYMLRDTPARQQRNSDFELLDDAQQLGGGGYSQVFTARHKLTGEVVAAKIIKSAQAQAEYIQMELSILRTLSHPNIVVLRGHEAMAADDQHAIFFEVCEGGDLFAYVRRSGLLSEAEARPCFAQIVAAVAYLHEQGIAHRDIKLENVLLAKNGCKLCDFGLAHAYSAPYDTADSRWLHEICGSKSYSAPEVLAGRGYDGFGADVWSCGVCLFAMLAGFFPYDEASETDWRYERATLAAASRTSTTRLIFGFYERPCVLSPAAVQLIDLLLAIAPAHRPSAAELDTTLLAPWLTTSASPAEQEPHQTGGGAASSWHATHARSMHHHGAAALAADGEADVEMVPVYRSGAGAHGRPLVPPPPELALQPRFRTPNGSAEQAMREARRLLRDASRKAQDAATEACKIS